jgi:DNA invertase Pin-like site-specific DNA recombinase
MIDIIKPIKFTCDLNDMVAYSRVSTLEQADDGAGMPAQRTAITREAAYKGYNIVEWCADPGFSGKDLKRPGMIRAMELVATGKARGIIVSKLDRLSRSLLDFANLMAQAQKGGFNIIALDLGVDLSTPSGELMANILATFAQFERRVISQRTKDGLAEKRAAGVVLGRPRKIPDEVIARIISLREQEFSYSVIADLFNREQIPTPQGGKKWYPASIREAFLSPAGAALAQTI